MTPSSSVTFESTHCPLEESWGWNSRTGKRIQINKRHTPTLTTQLISHPSSSDSGDGVPKLHNLCNWQTWPNTLQGKWRGKASLLSQESSVFTHLALQTATPTNNNNNNRTRDEESALWQLNGRAIGGQLRGEKRPGTDRPHMKRRTSLLSRVSYKSPDTHSPSLPPQQPS